MKSIMTCGAFDNPRATDLRFLQEASQLGELTVLLESDAAIERKTGKPPMLTLAERVYFLEAVRYVKRVIPLPDQEGLDCWPRRFKADLCVNPGGTEATARRQDWCAMRGLPCQVIPAARMAGFPEPPPTESPAGRKTVVVTGCYDWFHTGHIRFFEEVSAHGDLYVIVGHDQNIRLLKGEGHPLIAEAERRYMVGSIRYVKQALISSGTGWLDAEPEILRLKPDIYAVNEDGDKGGKREYCRERGIEYLVLNRTPAPGLPARSSTALRGF